jgi:DNA-binding protein
MQNEKKKNPILTFLGVIFYIVSIIGAYYVTYTYLGPRVEEIINNKDVNFVSKLSGKQQPKNEVVLENRGLRTAKIQDGYESIPKDIVSDVTYKDVRLISTARRSFTDREITMLKLVIDMMPQKLFDYRPWAIISTSFDSENFLTEINPEGVAFTSGPYIFVSDVTFKKQDSYDTGTYRGLMRVMAHEFVHVAQFFDTEKFPERFVSTYLENSGIVQHWTQTQGWELVGNHWELDKSQLTTDYGQSSPVEDMADAIGALVIGDEYVVSESRINWILQWLGTTKESLYQGTIPLSQTIKQRKTEASDEKYLTKYANTTALSQDLMNFQSTASIQTKDLAKFYATEFQKRGWTGTINANGVGEMTYQGRIKVNLEMDKNPLRVTTMVLTVLP